MTCFFPIAGWKASSPNPDTGKHSVVFNIRSGNPDEPIEIPCGKCSGCRADQSLMWSIRAYHESTQHERNSFITLTYDDSHLPSDGKINKKHLQDFFKRLRRDLPPRSVRYIACGEYGDKTRRPHYHALIFGLDFRSDSFTLKDDLYASPFLNSTWGHGNCMIAPVNMSTICYTCGYVTKKIGNPDTFSLASRRPPIGRDWLDKYKDDLIRTGSVVIEGREYVIPKRYLEWHEDDFQEIISERKRIARQGDLLAKRSALPNLQKNREARLSQRQEKL